MLSKCGLLSLENCTRVAEGEDNPGTVAVGPIFSGEMRTNCLTSAIGSIGYCRHPDKLINCPYSSGGVAAIAESALTALPAQSPGRSLTSPVKVAGLDQSAGRTAGRPTNVATPVRLARPAAQPLPHLLLLLLLARHLQPRVGGPGGGGGGVAGLH